MATLAVAPAFVHAMRQHLRRQLDQRVGQPDGGMSAPTRQLTGEQAAAVRTMILDALPATVSGQRLADALGMSTPEFYLAFRGTFGVAPVEMSRAARLATAQAKLVETRLSVADIAALTGYSHESNFARVFRKATGMTPRAWRAAGQRGSDPLPPSSRSARPARA